MQHELSRKDRKQKKNDIFVHAVFRETCQPQLNKNQSFLQGLVSKTGELSLTEQSHCFLSDLHSFLKIPNKWPKKTQGQNGLRASADFPERETGNADRCLHGVAWCVFERKAPNKLMDAVGFQIMHFCLMLKIFPALSPPNTQVWPKKWIRKCSCLWQKTFQQFLCFLLFQWLVTKTRSVVDRTRCTSTTPLATLRVPWPGNGTSVPTGMCNVWRWSSEMENAQPWVPCPVSRKERKKPKRFRNLLCRISERNCVCGFLPKQNKFFSAFLQVPLDYQCTTRSDCQLDPFDLWPASRSGGREARQVPNVRRSARPETGKWRHSVQTHQAREGHFPLRNQSDSSPNCGQHAQRRYGQFHHQISW